MSLQMYTGFLLVSCLNSLVIGQWMVPCSTQEASEASLPELPDQFTVNIQASIVQKQYTINMAEYYDYPNNRVVIELTDRHGKQKMRQLTDINTKEVHVLYDNGTCVMKKINTTNPSFSFMVAKDGAHLKTVKDLLYFGPDKGERFVDGDKQVRGIAVNHWTACVSVPRSNSSFTLDYYFSKGANFTLDGQEVQVPVRAVINGTGHSLYNGTISAETHSFYHIYDFTDFRAGPIHDPSVFEIPPGTYCHVDEKTKPTPSLPQQFSVGMEAVIHTNTGDSQFFHQQLYYDEAANVMRIDVDNMVASKDTRQLANRPLSIIQDRGNKMRYVLDKWEDNCTVLEASPSDNIVTPEDLIMLTHRANVYQGNKTLRGMEVESWAEFNKTDNTILDVLFRKTSSKSVGNSPFGRPQGKGDNPFYIPVGIFYRTIPNEDQAEQKMQVHLYGFSRSHPDPDVFDISPCYELGNHYSFLMVKTEGSYEIDVSLQKREYIAGVRAAIARGAGVSIMRITSISVEANSKNAAQLNVFFKLLDNSLYGSSNSKLPSLSAAKLNLQNAIAGGINFDVQYPTIEKNFEIVRNSLWEVSSSTDKTQESTIKRYSSASMAGLGIGMVVIGALLGLGVAYFIYKRIDTSVPYQITH